VKFQKEYEILFGNIKEIPFNSLIRKNVYNHRLVRIVGKKTARKNGLTLYKYVYRL